jgi:hypothetical protein
VEQSVALVRSFILAFGGLPPLTYARLVATRSNESESFS